MLKKQALLLVAAGIVLAVAVVYSANESQDSLVKRGEYLVNSVATCGDCHTARLPGGKPDVNRRFGGCPLDVQPVHEVPGWASYAPNITGGGILKNRTDEQLIKLFTTGVASSGKRPGPPHPQHRMTTEDAKAVVAYLRSLPEVQPGE